MPLRSRSPGTGAMRPVIDEKVSVGGCGMPAASKVASTMAVAVLKPGSHLLLPPSPGHPRLAWV
jgi:hypothetical protein